MLSAHNYIRICYTYLIYHLHTSNKTSLVLCTIAQLLTVASWLYSYGELCYNAHTIIRTQLHYVHETTEIINYIVIEHK